MKLFITTVFSTVLLSALVAQNESTGPWTIEKCVSHAIENNIQVKQSALQAELTKNSLNSAQWDFAPNLNASGNYGWNFGLNVDPVTNSISQTTRQTSSLGLNANWTLYSGGRRSQTLDKNNLDYAASKHDLSQMKNDISLNVASAYLQIILNQEILGVAIEQVRISQIQLDRTQKLVDAGASPQGDLFQLQSQLARDEQNKVASKNSVALSKLRLANLLQLDDPLSFEIVKPGIEAPEATVILQPAQSIYEVAVETESSIKSAQVQVSSSEKSVKISQSAYMPSVSLIAQVGTSYSDQIKLPVNSTVQSLPIGVVQGTGDVVVSGPELVPGGFEDKALGDQLNDNLNEYVAFNVSVPIFNRMTTRNTTQNAKINQDLADLQLQQEKLTLKQSVFEAHADAKAGYNAYLAAQKATTASEEAFKYASERAKVGAINQFDFENAKNNLAIAKSEMIRAKFDYVFKVKVLEFYLTRNIKF